MTLKYLLLKFHLPKVENPGATNLLKNLYYSAPGYKKQLRGDFMKIILFICAVLFSSFLLLSCKKDGITPPENQPKLKLESLDASCTEVWIKISTSDISLPANIKLLKDDNLSQIINLTSPDTILYVDSLLPNQTYHFKSSVINLQSAIVSNEIEVETMDTTSHNFTWQTFTFGGQAGSCVLNDVLNN